MTSELNKEIKKEEKKEFTPTTPNFRGDGVAVWKNVDKNGQTYMAVKILGGKAINCFIPRERALA